MTNLCHPRSPDFIQATAFTMKLTIPELSLVVLIGPSGVHHHHQQMRRSLHHRWGLYSSFGHF